MINFQFRFNKPYITATIANKIAALRRYDDIRLLAKCRKLSTVSKLSLRSLLLVPKQRSVFSSFHRDLEQIEHHEDVFKVLSEARSYRLTVKKQWLTNRERVSYELSRILRMPIPRRRISVYTTHPALHTGYSIPELHTICWGHAEEFKNYHSVYLTHEYLHIILPFDDREVDHALIELIADNELRVRLNGGGRYFQYPGHQRLLKLEKKLLPRWKRYLRRGSGSILGLLRECQEAG